MIECHGHFHHLVVQLLLILFSFVKPIDAALDSSVDSATTSVDTAYNEVSTIPLDSALFSDTLTIIQDTLPEDSSALFPASIDSVKIHSTKIDSEITSIKSFPDNPTLLSSPDSLLPGITPEQDFLARTYVSHFHSFSWSKANRTAKKLQRLEKKGDLPPLSFLLMITCRVTRVLNGEYGSQNERKQLLKEIDDLEKKVTRQIDMASISDSLLPIHLFITGGIRGVVATLKIENNIVEAAVDGFHALNDLQECIALFPTLHDAYLGLGIFYCSLAHAPGIVRAALNLTGHSISFEKGLDYLRISARSGRYTSELSSLYLIQFLSPYWGHLTAEKDSLFSSLQHRYPQNPFYVFLEVDENICFHPNRIDSLYTQRINQKMLKWHPDNFSTQRYAQLIKWQINFITNSKTPPEVKPNSAFDLREFSFYPLFLEALALRRATEPKTKSNSRRVWGQLTKNESFAIRTLGLSSMSSTRRNFYEWHIRDALRLQ